MIVLSDIHGDTRHARRVCEDNPTELVVQIGDCGVGFGRVAEEVAKLPKNFRFYCGNHDCREEAVKLDSYLGDFGYYKNLFFWISGADSIDKESRIEGVSWWRDEELSVRRFNECLDFYERVKPKVVLSHDGPQEAIERIFNVRDRSSTRQALQAMFEIHQPELWVFAHWHQPKQARIRSTIFRVLQELETLKL